MLFLLVTLSQNDTLLLVVCFQDPITYYRSTMMTKTFHATSRARSTKQGEVLEFIYAR